MIAARAEAHVATRSERSSPLLPTFTEASATERFRLYEIARDEISTMLHLRENLTNKNASTELISHVNTALTDTVSVATRMNRADPFLAIYSAVLQLARERPVIDSALVKAIDEQIRPILVAAVHNTTAENTIIPVHVAQLLAHVGTIGSRYSPIEGRQKLLTYMKTGLTAIGQREYLENVSPGLAAWYARKAFTPKVTGDLLIDLDSDRDRLATAGRAFVENSDPAAVAARLAEFTSVAAKTEQKSFSSLAITERLIADAERKLANPAIRAVHGAELKAIHAEMLQVRSQLWLHLGQIKFQRGSFNSQQRAEQNARGLVMSIMAPHLESELAHSAAAKAAVVDRTPSTEAHVAPLASQAASQPADNPPHEVAATLTPVARDVARLLRSHRHSQQLEGRIARRLLDIDLLDTVAVNRIVRNDSRILTEFDVETRYAIFEVTNARSGKLKQMRRRTTREYNPLLKDQVLVVPLEFDESEKQKIVRLSAKKSENDTMRTFVTTENGLDDICFALANRYQSRFFGTA